MSEIKIDFEPIIGEYIKGLRKQGMSFAEEKLWLASALGRRDFEVYCTACIKLQAKMQLEQEKITSGLDALRAY